MKQLTKHIKSICLRHLPALALLMLSVGGLRAQDLHFSQFMHNPLLINPANAGFNPDYDFRVGGSYRNQWWGLPVPYRTISLWGDVQLMRGGDRTGWLGVGGVLLRDVAGNGNLTSTKGYGSIAWHQEIGYASLISGGFNIGFASKNIDFTKFRWENQWNGKFFDSRLPSGEQFAYSQIGYLDLQAGLNYAYFPSERVYINAGVSMMHLNRPRESFFSEEVSDNRIPERYNAFANASVKVNEQWIVNPSVYYSYQSGSSEIVGGLMAQYNLGDGSQQLIGGAYMRWKDAVVPMVGYQWSDIRLTASYDVTLSGLRNYNNGNGAIEFSLIKVGVLNGRTPRDARCPQF